MKTREQIGAAASAAGWRKRGVSVWSDTYERLIDCGGPLARIAVMGKWDLKEQIQVSFGDRGRLIDAVRRTPDDQAAIDGKWVSSTDTTSGRNQKGQILRWLAAPPWQPAQ